MTTYDPQSDAAKLCQSQPLGVATEQGHHVITGHDAEKLAPHGVYSYLDIKGYKLVDDTLRKALNTAGVRTTMIEDVRKGALVELVATKDIPAEAAPAEPPRVAEDRQKRAAAKAESAFRHRLFGEIMTAIDGELARSIAPVLDDYGLRLIVRQFYVRLYDDTKKALAMRYVPDGRNATERLDAMPAIIEALSPAGLIRFAHECALVGTLDVPHWMGERDTPAPLLDTAAEYNIDPAALRKLMTAESRAAQAKPAKKVSPPTPAPRGGEVSAAQKPKPTPKAARAGGRVAKEKKEQAANAASKAKTKNSGRASPAGGKPCTAGDPPAVRCDKTIDMYGGASA